MANHRADRRAASWRRTADSGGSSQRPGGHRRADGAVAIRGAGRAPLLRGLPSATTLVGVCVLVMAAAGSLSMGAADGATSRLAARHLPTYAAHASARAGSSVVAGTAVGDRRQRAVSRDSQREALKDAASQHLQQAAEKQAKERNAALTALAASAEKQAGRLAEDVWHLPVTSGVYHLTSRFGDCSSLWSHCHTGLDFAAPEGTPIHAIASGTVTTRGSTGAYGNRTIVTLEDGTKLWYCHQSAFSVQQGQKVTAGQVLGAVGATGNVTGPHLHVEVRPSAGHPVDPYTVLVAHGLKP